MLFRSVATTQRFLRQTDWWDGPYDIVFADPPYADQAAIALVLESWHLDVLAPEAVMIIEQHAKVHPPAAGDQVKLLRRYDYGDTALLLYGKTSDGSVA